MTKEEFETLVGYPVADQEYKRANAVYMACSCSLDDFIKDYKAHKCDLLLDITESLEYEKHLKEHANELLLNLVGCIMSEVDEAGENCGKHLSSLRDHARIALGERDYVKLCLEKGYSLQDADREYLLRALS